MRKGFGRNLSAGPGAIAIDGIGRNFSSPADARAAGIGMVHQELVFCPDLSIAENLCMGNYPGDCTS